ncbi:hypothetical protein DL346_26745 [Paenibacillus montanisoli]|uniref:Uncharacterized protein n=1 Tax=Paenibacillus montanisoli TaxID=2081970 RepID=A0A328TTH9_9BACL|nr:hypothetical protein DL346_26745 [Paenibacillus montanisoli]
MVGVRGGLRLCHRLADPGGRRLWSDDDLIIITACSARCGAAVIFFYRQVNKRATFVVVLARLKEIAEMEWDEELPDERNGTAGG